MTHSLITVAIYRRVTSDRQNVNLSGATQMRALRE